MRYTRQALCIGGAAVLAVHLSILHLGKRQPFIPINIQYRQPLTLLLFPSAFQTFNRSSPRLNVSHTSRLHLTLSNNTWKYPNYLRSSAQFSILGRGRGHSIRASVRWRWRVERRSSHVCTYSCINTLHRSDTSFHLRGGETQKKGERKMMCEGRV